MGDQAQQLFKEATEAYVDERRHPGRRARRHGQLPRRPAAAVRAGDLREPLRRQASTCQVAVQLAVVARFYERIGDHAVNIGERVRYVVTGWVPEHDGRRPLRDASRGERPGLGAAADGDRRSCAIAGADRRRRGWVLAWRSCRPRAACVASTTPPLGDDARRASVAAHPAGDGRRADAGARSSTGSPSASSSPAPSGADPVPQPGRADVAGRHARSACSSTTAVEQLLAAAPPRASTRARRSSCTARRRVAVVVHAVAAARRRRRRPTIEDVSERRRVDAVRTDFVANISHELKTPVGALAVLAETLADEDDLEVVQPRRRPHGRARRTASRARSTTCSSCRGSSSARSRSASPSTSVDVVAGAVERVAAAGRAARHRRSTSLDDARRRSSVARRPPPARVGARQPRRERGQVQRAAAAACRSASRVEGDVGRADGRRPRHRHPGRATTTGSSSASTASTGPAAATPAAPVSDCRSSATSPPTTAARCWCRRTRARARRSCCGSRWPARSSRPPDRPPDGSS